MPKIIFKHGSKSTLPKLDFREPGITDDTEEIFVGGNTQNIQLAKQTDLDSANTNIGQKADKTYVDTKTGDLTGLQTSHTDNLVNAINDNVVSLTDNMKLLKDFYLNVTDKQFGAKGDGVTDDTAAIQAALNLAKVTKVKVLIPPLTYKITSFLRLYQNTEIYMYGATILRGHSGGYFKNGDDGATYSGYNGNGNIVIRGGVLEGNIANFATGYEAFGLAHGQNLKFIDMEIRDLINTHSFDINGCKDVVIDGCRFLGFKYTDVAYQDKEAIQIAEHSQLGFADFGAYDGTPCQNITIKNCYFGASGTVGTQPPAIGIGNHLSVYNKFNDTIKIYDNTFDGMTYAGIRALKYKNVWIERNKFIGCQQGILISSAFGGVAQSSKDENGVQSGVPQAGETIYIKDNKFINMLTYGVYAYGTIYQALIAKTKSIHIEDNEFINDTLSSYEAVYLKWSDEVYVYRNKVRNFARGAYAQYTSSFYFDDNDIADLKWEGVYSDEPDVDIPDPASDPNYDAVTYPASYYRQKGYTTKFRLRRNEFLRVARTGINLQYVDGFRIENNTLDTIATETDNTRDGIKISNSAKNGKIFKNRVKLATSGNQPLYGIEVTATCSFIQLQNNDVEGKTAKQSLPSAVTSIFDGTYITSPNGTRYKMTVSDVGATVYTAG